LIKRFAWLVLVFALVLALPTPILAAEPGTGTIEGQLVNKSAGGGSVAGLEVTLTTNLNDQEAGSATTKSDVDGRFAFSGLSTEIGYNYQAKVTYEEAEYDSDWLSFGANETSKTVELTVYNSTASDAAIKVATAHTVIYVGQGSLDVMEYYLITNEADLTYIGSGEITSTGKRKTVSFPLPPKATNFQYGGDFMECCILNGQGGFFDTMPVLPGGKEVVYSYRVDYGSGAYTFSRDVNLPTVSYDLLVQGDSSKVISDQLAIQEPVTIEGTSYQHFTASNIARGDTVVARLSGMPSASNQMILVWVVLAVVVVVIFSLFVFLRRRSRLQPEAATAAARPDPRRTLLLELAQLDDAFEAGKIPEDTYRRERALKKAELIRLIQMSKGEGSQ
jgi:hypothetical protein